jgi:hypothetical protein
MIQPSLPEMSTDELVNLFAQNCIEQDQAIFKEQVSAYKKIFAQMDAINAEVKLRGPQARLALKRLYCHPNMQVRLKAARQTVGLDPAGARQVLEAIARSGRMPQAADARETLRKVDEGALKPD